MNNTDLSTLTSRLKFMPKNLQEALLMKTNLVTEFTEQDIALNEIIAKMTIDEAEARMDEQRRKEWIRLYDLWERRNNE